MGRRLIGPAGRPIVSVVGPCMQAAASIACTAGIEREPEGRYHRWRSRGREREKDRLREADSDHTHLTPSTASPLCKTVQHLSEGRGEWAYSREKKEQKERNAGHEKEEKPWKQKQGYVKN